MIQELDSYSSEQLNTSDILKESVMENIEPDGIKRNPILAKPVSVTEQIYSELSEAIISGKLKPGEVLVEKEMQKWFGVSRSPIRESIRILESEGLIVVDAYKKKYVRRLTEEYIKNLLQMASCVEGFAARLSCENFRKNDISELEQINNKLNIACKAKDYEKCTEQNFKFHRFIMQASDNDSLRRVARFVTKPMEFIFLTRMYFGQNDRIAASINEHKLIIKAFKKGDADLVEKEVRKHVLNPLKSYMEIAIFDENGDLVF